MNDSKDSPPAGYLLFVDSDLCSTQLPDLETLRRDELMDIESQAESGRIVLKIDVLSSIRRCRHSRDDTIGQLSSIEYSYFRLDKEAQFEVFAFPSNDKDEIRKADEYLNKIDFLLCQYSFCQTILPNDNGKQTEAGQANILAKGLEGSGRVTRTALHLTGVVRN